MHYCCEIVTKEFPTNQVITEILLPFDWESQNAYDEKNQPAFTYDWWQIGGRYSGKLKLRVDKEDEKYNWEYYATVPRAGRLFRSKLLETIDSLVNKNSVWEIEMARLSHEEDLYNELGYRDGYIRVDGAPIKDLIDFEKDCTKCWCLVDVDGKAYARVHYEDDPEFEQTVQNIFANGNRDDCYVVIVDLHD